MIVSYPWEQDLKKLRFEDLYFHYQKWALGIIFETIKFENLPETVSETFLKYLIFMTGKATFFKAGDDGIVSLYGVPSDVPNIYYIPQKMIVSDPYLTSRTSYTLTLEEDCKVVYCTECDKYFSGVTGGLYMFVHKFATLLADNDISINVAQKNTRLTNIISADQANAKRSIDEVIARMYDGDPTICVQSSLVNTLNSIPFTQSASNTYLIQLVELRQYILSQFYSALGIYIHDNMKKERLITDEITDGDDMAYINIENIFETIKKGIEGVNSMFNTDIKVYLNPILKTSEEEPEQSDEEQETTSQEEPEQSDEEQETTSQEEPEQSDEEQEATSEEEPEQAETVMEISDNENCDITVIVGGDESDDNDESANVGNSNGNDSRESVERIFNGADST